jgi:hypothetical protein
MRKAGEKESRKRPLSDFPGFLTSWFPHEIPWFAPKTFEIVLATRILAGRFWLLFNERFYGKDL